MVIIGVICFGIGIICGVCITALMVASGNDDKCRECEAYKVMMQALVNTVDSES